MRVVVVCVMASVGIAAADPPPSQAMTLFAEGRELLAANRPADACAKFQAALAIEPEDMGPILNLGLCNEQLDKLATALHWFRRAQQRASELGMHDTEDAAREKTTLLATRVPTIKLDLDKPLAAGTLVNVDGEKIDQADITRLEVDAGHHVVELALTDARPVRAEVDARDGEQTALNMTAPVVIPGHVVDIGATRRRHAYWIGGIGGGLWVGGLAFGLIGKHEFDTTEHPVSQQHWKDAVRYGDTAAFAVGTLAVGVAVWMYVTAPQGERLEQTVVAPVVGRDHVGVALTRDF